MYDKRMMSFRSRHYPRSNVSAFRVRQEIAMRYYAVLMFVVLIAVMLRVTYQKDPIWFGIVGVLVAVGLGNVMAKVQLRRNVAEIFFLNDGFAIISIEDILSQSPKRSFPLRFADPTRSPEQIHFNFEDQIITLNREDWGTDFELIWEWLNQDLREYQTAAYVQPESLNNPNDAPQAPEDESNKS